MTAAAAAPVRIELRLPGAAVRPAVLAALDSLGLAAADVDEAGAGSAGLCYTAIAPVERVDTVVRALLAAARSAGDPAAAAAGLTLTVTPAAAVP